MKGGKKKNINYNIFVYRVRETEILQSIHAIKEKTVYLNKQEICEAH